MIFQSKNQKDGNKKKTINTFIKRSLSVTALAMVAACLMWVSGFTTYAKRNLPTGDMDYIPQAQYCGEIEITEENAGLLKPNGVNVELDTGEHYKYLSSDEKILYEAIYKGVMSGSYLKYKDLSQYTTYKKNKENDKLLALVDDIVYPFYTGDKLYSDYYINFDAYSYALNRAAEACYYDHADHVELYMVYGYDLYSSKTSDGKVKSYILFMAKEDDTKFDDYNKAITAEVNYIKTVLSPAIGESLNTWEWEACKEWFMHDLYCTDPDFSPVYDTANLSKTGDASYFDYAHTAYGSMVTKKAVCDGYSAGFELIMNALNVNTMVITGEINGGGHAWNIVQLDGNWYEVDTTWDDCDDVNDPELHKYFNKTTQEFLSGIPGAVHKRVENDGYCGFRMPLARGTHWTIERILSNDPYVHDTNVLVSALRIEDNFDLNYGATYEPKVTIFPENATNKEYTLTSSNPDVVSVEGNTIKGLKIGTVTLTATSTDGALSDACTVTVTVFEGSEITKSGNTYRITGENTAEIIGSTKATVNIPATIKVGSITFKVTAVGDNAFKKNKKITTVKGGKNLTSIGKNAFRECPKLKNVKLSTAGSLKTIGATAFYKSGKVKVLQLNTNKLSKVGKNAVKKINKDAKFTITASSKKKYNKAVKLFKKAGAKEATYEKYEKKK